MRPLGAAWVCFSDPEALSLIPRGRESTDLLRPSHLPPKGGELPYNKPATSACPRQHRAAGKKRKVGGEERALDELCQSAPRVSRPRRFGPLISSEDSGGRASLHHVPPSFFPPFCTSAEPQAPSTTKCSLSLRWSPRHLEAVAKLTKSRAWSGRQSYSSDC